MLCFIERLHGTEAKAAQTTAKKSLTCSEESKGTVPNLQSGFFLQQVLVCDSPQATLAFQKYVILFFFFKSTGPGCLKQSSFLHEEWVISLCIQSPVRQHCLHRLESRFLSPQIREGWFCVFMCVCVFWGRGRKHLKIEHVYQPSGQSLKLMVIENNRTQHICSTACCCKRCLLSTLNQLKTKTKNTSFPMF